MLVLDRPSGPGHFSASARLVEAGGEKEQKEFLCQPAVPIVGLSVRGLRVARRYARRGALADLSKTAEERAHPMSNQPRNWQQRFRAFGQEEEGVSGAEYAIMLALIVAGSLVIIRAIGDSFRGLYLAIAAAIPDT